MIKMLILVRFSFYLLYIEDGEQNPWPLGEEKKEKKKTLFTFILLSKDRKRKSISNQFDLEI